MVLFPPMTHTFCNLLVLVFVLLISTINCNEAFCENTFCNTKSFSLSHFYHLNEICRISSLELLQYYIFLQRLNEIWKVRKIKKTSRAHNFYPEAKLFLTTLYYTKWTWVSNKLLHSTSFLLQAIKIVTWHCYYVPKIFQKS